LEEYRVIGPPGCGKTTYLKRQVENAVRSLGPKSVLIASLTKAAAEEVAGRGLPIDEDRINTLHAHAFHAIGCPKVVQEKGTIKLWNEAHPHMAMSLDGLNVDDGADTKGNEPGDDLLLEYSSLRARMIPREKWMKKDILHFGREWDSFKHDLDAIDFTDMIELALERTDVAPGAPACIFLDEAQDMDRLQLALVRKWAQHCIKLVIVGDPDQNLYEWRGTDAKSFTDHPIPKENTIVLSQSYRVPRAVHAVACRWIKNAQGRTEAPYHPRDYDGEVRVIGPGSDEILEDMQPYIEQGKTIMILASCGMMLGGIIALLRAEGIPFHNPYKKKRGDWNPLRFADRVLSYLSTDPELYGEHAGLWTWGELHSWTQVIASDGVMNRGAKKSIAERAKVREEAKSQTTLPELGELFIPGACEVNDLRWFRKHLLSTAPKSVAYAVNVAEARGKEAIRSKPKVIVGTIHSTKGGEADVVYLMTDLSYPAFQAWQDESCAEFSAVVRQFYVGITRAKETLVVCEASGRALAIPAEYLS
jgi:DNA helicase II / ATP-dependent DNA helicase PcrA